MDREEDLIGLQSRSKLPAWRDQRTLGTSGPRLIEDLVVGLLGKEH